MQKETESISKSIKVKDDISISIYIDRVKEAGISTLKFTGSSATTLSILGRKEDGTYLYNFDLYSYEKFTNLVDTIHKILDDVVTSKEFKHIDFIIFQSAVKFNQSTLLPFESPEDRMNSLNRKDYNGNGFLFMVESIEGAYTEMIHIKNNEAIINKDGGNSMLKNADKTGQPNLKKYLNKNNMATSAPAKQNDIWKSLSIDKNQFDWIDDVITESKKIKRSLTDTIKVVVQTVRNDEFNITNSKEKNIECSTYELKLFLAGKIFEEKLRKQL